MIITITAYMWFSFLGNVEVLQEHLKIKHVLRSFIACENRGERLGEFESRSMKIREAVKGFTCSRILTNVRLSFHQAMKALITCFISLIKLLFSVLRKRKTIYEARMYT